MLRHVGTFLTLSLQAVLQLDPRFYGEMPNARIEDSDDVDEPSANGDDTIPRDPGEAECTAGNSDGETIAAGIVPAIARPMNSVRMRCQSARASPTNARCSVALLSSALLHAEAKSGVLAGSFVFGLLGYAILFHARRDRVAPG